MEQIVYLQEVCKFLNACSSAPVTLYENDVAIKRYEIIKLPDGFDCETKYYDVLRNAASDISYKIDEKFLFGMVKVKETNISIFIGPVCIMPIQNHELKKIAFNYNCNIEQLSVLSNYVYASPIMPLQFALQILSFLNLVVNKEVLPNSEFVMSDVDDFPDSTVHIYSNLQKHLESITFDEIERHSSLEFENLMLSYIQNGQVANLKKLFETTPIGRTGQIAYDVLRQEKNNSICSITLCTRAAISGGLNSETAFQLSDLTIQKIENCRSVNEIQKLSGQIITDFCERVSTLQNNPNNSPVINRVVKYINENIADKITVEELAQLVHTNRSFLSSKFKSEMGIPLIEYIAKQKIAEAKRLLLYSDKSLSSIAAYLSFSSQSHFQNTFKKITGLTPAEYRKNKKRE